MQCGADLLSGDPIGSFSLTPHGVGSCVTAILQWGLPTLLLGGGWSGRAEGNKYIQCPCLLSESFSLACHRHRPL